MNSNKSYGKEEKTIEAWHEFFLNVLLRYNEIHSDFSFAMRPKNIDNKRGQNLWFMGKEAGNLPSICIGLTKNIDNVQDLYSIGISVLFSRKKTILPIPGDAVLFEKINFYVACKTERNKEYEGLFQDVLKNMNITYKGWKKIYTKSIKYNSSIENSLVKFLDSYGLAIQKTFLKYPTSGFQITPDEFASVLMEKRGSFGLN